MAPLNSDQNPALRGSIVVLYATGAGQNLAGRRHWTGVPPSASSIGLPQLPVSPTVAGNDSGRHSCGPAAAPGFVGLLQINARIPSGFISTATCPVLTVGTYQSAASVTIAVE